MSERRVKLILRSCLGLFGPGRPGWATTQVYPAQVPHKYLNGMPVFRIDGDLRGRILRGAALQLDVTVVFCLDHFDPPQFTYYIDSNRCERIAFSRCNVHMAGKAA